MRITMSCTEQTLVVLAHLTQYQHPSFRRTANSTDSRCAYQALADAIDKFYKDSDLAVRTGALGRVRALHQFSHKAMTQVRPRLRSDLADMMMWAAHDGCVGEVMGVLANADQRGGRSFELRLLACCWAHHD